MRKTGRAALFVVLASFGLSPVQARADFSGGRSFELLMSHNEALCKKIHKILNLSENKSFGDFIERVSFSVEDKTSEFKVPEDEHDIRWVKWNPVEKHISQKVLSAFFQNEETLMRLQGLKGLPFSSGPYMLHVSTLRFPDKRDDSRYISVPMLLAIDPDIRYTNQKCYISEVKDRADLSEAAIHRFNSTYISHWCSYFTYEGKLYKSGWVERSPWRSLEIVVQSYDAENHHIAQNAACSYKYQLGKA